MPSNTHIPAAELLRLADAAIKSAAEHILVLYPEGWADIEAYRAARAQSPVTMEERLLIETLESQEAYCVEDVPFKGPERDRFAAALKARDDHARALAEGPRP